MIDRIHVVQFQFDHGPGRLANTLKKGLTDRGIELVSFNEAEYIACLQWLDEHLDVADFANKKVLVGPNIWEAPSERPHVAKGFNDFIVPSQWVKDKHLTDPLGQGPNVHIWSGGIETDIWTPHDIAADIDCFIYFKNRSRAELDSLTKTLSDMGLKFGILEYGGYREEHLLEACHRSKFSILLNNTESQGYAYMQILSTNTPCIVLDQDYLISRDGNTRWPATSVPYFDDRCGIKVKTIDREGIGSFINSLDKFDPRSYILENHTIEISTEKYLSLLENL